MTNNNGERIVDTKEIANEMNVCFSRISNDSPLNVKANINDIRLENSLESIFFDRTDDFKIKSLMYFLNNHKSTGPDNLPVFIIKQCSQSIAPYLTSIANVMLSQRIFPDALKAARVCPILNSGDKSKPTNYRPISVLPLLDKIF